MSGSYYRLDLDRIARESDDYFETLYTRAPHAEVECACPDGSTEKKILPLESLQLTMIRLPPTHSTPREKLSAEVYIHTLTGKGLLVVENTQTLLSPNVGVVIPSGLNFSVTNDSISTPPPSADGPKPPNLRTNRTEGCPRIALQESSSKKDTPR